MSLTHEQMAVTYAMLVQGYRDAHERHRESRLACIVAWNGIHAIRRMAEDDGFALAPVTVRTLPRCADRPRSVCLPAISKADIK